MGRFAKMAKRYALILISIIFLGLYFYIYFGLTHFVFFNFDMPRQAIHVQEFLQKGTFLTAQYFSEESVWKNISWGPTGVFFYALFLRISNDPLTVSYLLSAVNLIPIAAIVIMIWKSFSKEAAIISAFLLAFNPYWLTYARIIYVPSPLTFFIPISMFLFFEGIYRKKGWAQTLLPVSWVALIQTYLPTYSFIFTSFVAVCFYFKNLKIKYIGVGIILSLILLLPTIVFYKDNPLYIERIFEAPSLFTPQEKNFTERFKKVSIAYSLITIGGRFDIPMGYGFNDFVKNHIPVEPAVTFVLAAIFITALIWNLYKGIFKREYKRLFLFFLAITPVWSMVALWVSEILPRYFLVGFPAAMILIALFLVDLKAIFKLSWIIYVGIILYWCIFNYLYNDFIRKYDYPSGRLGESAETPYIFLRDSLMWIDTESKLKNCDPVITNSTTCGQLSERSLLFDR